MALNQPRWTQARLQRLMTLRYGSNSVHTGPNTAAVAAAMGVSQRTVQRWLTGSGRSTASIPRKRLEQFESLLLPDSATLAQEVQQARYAMKAIDRMRLPRKVGIKPEWERQRWLESHLVVVLESRVDKVPIRQLAVARNSLAKLQELKRRGNIVDEAVVETKFHATVLGHTVLTDLRAWRFQARPGQVSSGFTQVWVVEPSTPQTKLTALALSQSRELQHFPHTKKGSR